MQTKYSLDEVQICFLKGDVTVSAHIQLNVYIFTKFIYKFYLLSLQTKS